MLTALRTTIFMVPHMPALAAVGWAAARRDDRLVIAVSDRPQSWLHVKQAILEALTDDEYAAYELTLPVTEQQRRIDITWGDRHLSRRHAMLLHLERHTDQSYAAYEETLPPQEMERRIIALTARRLDLTLPVPRQAEPVPAA